MAPDKLFLYLSLSDSEVDTLHSILSKTENSLLNERITYVGRMSDLAKKGQTVIPGFKDIQFIQNELTEAFNNPVSGENHTYILIDHLFRNHSKPSHAARFQRDLLLPFMLDVNIVFYLKRQDFFIETSFVNNILNQSAESFDKYINQFNKPDLNWYQLLEDYSEIFGKEKVHVHEHKKSYFTKKRDFIRHFGNLVGSTYLKNYMGSISENNFSTDVLEAIRLTNHHMQEDEWEKIEKLFENDTHLKKKNSFFTDQERIQFLKKYDDLNAKIIEEYVSHEQEKEVFFNGHKKLKKNDNDEELLIESLTVTFAKAALDLKNKTDELLQEQKKKNPVEKTLLNIWSRIRSLLHK